MDFFGILFDMKNGSKVPYSKNNFDTLFAAKLADLQIKTLTGTLPLTFRTSETALRSWTIYGNNYEHTYSADQTLPLTFSTNTAGAASDWTIYGNDNVGKNLLNIASSTAISHTTITNADNATGSLSITAEAGYTYRGSSVIITDLLEVGKTYILTLTNNAEISLTQRANVGLRRVDSNSFVASVGSNDFASVGDKSVVYTHTQEYAESGIYFSVLANGNNSDGGSVSISNAMIREATTSADFKPYQVGVGQRTKNQLEITATSDETELNGIKFTVDKENGIIIANGQATAQRVFNVGTITNNTSEPIDYYLSGGADGGAESSYVLLGANGNVRLKRWDGTTDMSGSTSLTNVQQMQIPAGVTGTMRIYIRNGTVCENLVFKPMVRLPDTSADFVPYGYEIPLSVNNTPQTFYIGDSPLTAGQSISKTSTGVDISAVQGANTITTDLYNKPEMSIEGVDYVGVGEPVNDSWQIPLTVTHYTDNIFDKDAKNANKGYEDSTCIMWAGSIPYPYMTGNIPEDNNCFVSEKIPASPNTIYYLTDGIFKNTDNGIYSVFLWNRFRMSDYQAFPTEKTFTTGDDTKFIQLCVLKSYADTVMITTQPTETYIPHVEVNNVNVPIDAPLTEGESVTDTLTISTFEGENTLDTTMTNKPQMSITYKGG